jgi:hypothetical protein
LKTADAILVTDSGRKSAILSADSSNDGLPVLLVDGVACGAKDLPAGSYLEVRNSEMAHQAALAGFVTALPGSVKRRAYTITGKFMGVVLLVGAVIALYWAVRDVLELDLLGALVWVGMAVFIGLLGIFYWSYGSAYMLEEDAARASNVERVRRRVGSFVRRR